MIDLDPIQGSGGRRCGTVDRLGFGVRLAPPAAFGQRQGVQSAADGALRRGTQPLLMGLLTDRANHLGGGAFLARQVEIINQASNQVFARFGQTPLPAPPIGATHQQGGQRTVGFAQALQAGIHLTLGQP